MQRLSSVQQLWPPRLGVMELGIVECKGLLSMRTADGKGCIDAYAVAKYGPKWTRMCTIADSYCWNRTNTHERGGLEHRTHKKLAAGRSTHAHSSNLELTQELCGDERLWQQTVFDSTENTTTTSHMALKPSDVLPSNNLMAGTHACACTSTRMHIRSSELTATFSPSDSTR